MEIRLSIRRQYVVTFDEEEAQNIRRLLDGLQESDYDLPFRRMQCSDPADQNATKKAFKDFQRALELVPAADSATDTRHL